jgi:hypothetical protein
MESLSLDNFTDKSRCRTESVVKRGVVVVEVEGKYEGDRVGGGVIMVPGGSGVVVGGCGVVVGCAVVGVIIGGCGVVVVARVGGGGVVK